MNKMKYFDFVIRFFRDINGMQHKNISWKK